MATTTNYGWTTPDDTALVKDGASAIRTLGTSVDTTTKNLNPETTLGDISFRSSTSNVNTRLGIGSTGQVLTVASGVPSWATASSGGITLISETVASALSSLSLSSIPSTYKHLVLTWHGIYQNAQNSGFGMRFNNNSTAGAYQGKMIAFQPTLNFTQFANLTDASFGSAEGNLPFGDKSGTTANLSKNAMGCLTIYNYASATKLKYYEITNSLNDVNDTKKYYMVMATFNDVTAISSIDIYRDASTDTFSNATNTSIRLYGVS